jgi:glycosyltransferase involved in cell wall biosynthesis
VITNALPPGIEALCDRLAAARAGRAGRKVISVVRLSPEKNVEALIEAAARGGARFEVVIYGRGPHEVALRARAEARGGVADRITFAGQLPREGAGPRGAMRCVCADEPGGGPLAGADRGRAHRLPLVVSDVASQRGGERDGRQPLRAGAAPA